MKLAEALVKAKDLKGKLSSLHNEIVSEQYFEKLDASQEVPNHEAEIVELVDVSDELRQLKTKIDLTNAKHGITDKIHEMEKLRYLVNSFSSLCGSKQETVQLRRVDYEGPAVPITTVATYNVENAKKQLEKYRDDLRSLDLEIQKLNWQIDLE